MASNVLPQPGGPANSMPGGFLKPSLANWSGKWTGAWRDEREREREASKYIIVTCVRNYNQSE